jgi:hypothetical protein
MEVRFYSRVCCMNVASARLMVEVITWVATCGLSAFRVPRNLAMSGELLFPMRRGIFCKNGSELFEKSMSTPCGIPKKALQLKYRGENFAQITERSRFRTRQHVTRQKFLGIVIVCAAGLRFIPVTDSAVRIWNSGFAIRGAIQHRAEPKYLNDRR